MATPSSFGNGKGNNMNASLWGKLQIFIDLSMIYTKLPLAPFFRLRQVCKEWNRLASDCQFLEHNFKPPISSNPYFILTHQSEGHVLLISEGSLWNSMPMPQMQCEMSGLLFDSNCNRVFDIHTRVFHTLPPLPMAMQPLPLLTDAYTMMIVDTSQNPYGFRIIIADGIIGTMIYESNCGFWTHKPSTPAYYPRKYSTSCVYNNKSLYFKVEDFDWGLKIQTYNLETDEWNLENIYCSLHKLHYSDIGLWQDQWFLFLEEEKEDGLDLTVDNLENFSDFKIWVSNVCMPKDLRKWMQGSRYDNIVTKCCGKHLLVYNRTKGVNRAILYNLDQKTWDKIEFFTIPML